MHFTREPVTETIITPKEGFKLVVRNSKGIGQEEFFVDALEIVSFGHALFFRSLEKPKSFLVPVSDYEVLEVRDTRLVLKHTTVDRAIKIGGGRDVSSKNISQEKGPKRLPETTQEDKSTDIETVAEQQLDKKRDRRRHSRKKRSREEVDVESKDETSKSFESENGKDRNKSVEKKISKADNFGRGGDTRDEMQVSSSVLPTLIPPPKALISDRIGLYKDYAIVKEPVLSDGVEEVPDVSAESEENSVKSESVPEGVDVVEESTSPTVIVVDESQKKEEASDTVPEE